jgi:hypothetical protein
MTKFKLINTILLFAVLSGNAVADEVSSKAIYDSKTKTLALEGVLVPFIDEFTGKETDNKGIFDAQLQEKTKLVFELIPWSINFKNTFNGENTSGYILYDHKTRSVKIPCFKVTTIAKFGDGIEGESIYYKDVNMKQRHVAYPIFHVDDMTKTDSCESSVEPIKKPTLTTTPTITPNDAVEVEVNGENGTAVFVNGVDSGEIIDSTGKVKITLDTSGETGDKSFSISLKDGKGNESEALTFVIIKENTLTESLVAHYEFDNKFINSVNGIDESSKWEHSKDVNIQDGSLKLINNSDGDPKRSTSITIDTSSYTSLTLEKRSKIIAKGYYSFSGTIFQVSKNSSSVNYNYYHYSKTNDVCQYDCREHFYINNKLLDSNNNLLSHDVSDLIDTRFSQWIKEKITLDFANNKMTYEITDDDGSNAETLEITIMFEENNTTKISLNAWDWANGSEHIVDDLKIYAK